MAKIPAQTTSSEESETAISKVLEEEQAACRAIDEVKHQAQDLLHEAHTRAQQIHQRGDERIRNIHARCDAAIALHIKELETEQTQTGVQGTLNSDTDSMLNKAVADVAEQLITPNKIK